MTVDERDLAERHAVVTGGGQGIGAAVADELARRGATVTIMGRTAATLMAHAAALRAAHGGAVGTAICDVADEESVRSAFASATGEFGAVHVLVNNAGQAETIAFGDLTRDRWDAMLAVNLTGTYLCTRQVLSDMLRLKSGRIVNIASTAGLRGYSHTAAYCAAKHGVVGLTRALALETAKHGITVNAVCPGYTDTAIAAAAIHNVSARMKTTLDEAEQALLRTIPRRQFTGPDEVASLVGWLCSPAAAAVTGVSVPVAGGEVT
ncbi:MAG TPA: SDR family NAD(P)-dependent oxidoreductase [Gemmatimonadaceae bacterium]|nr:SDR family NAD(P)-dependent oxidoreductase [Gemmatimonadaceae bacterium]